MFRPKVDLLAAAEVPEDREVLEVPKAHGSLVSHGQPVPCKRILESLNLFGSEWFRHHGSAS